MLNRIGSVFPKVPGMSFRKLQYGLRILVPIQVLLVPDNCSYTLSLCCHVLYLHFVKTYKKNIIHNDLKLCISLSCTGNTQHTGLQSPI